MAVQVKIASMHNFVNMHRHVFNRRDLGREREAEGRAEVAMDEDVNNPHTRTEKESE